MKPVKPPRINGRVPVLSAQEAVNYIPDEATLCVLGAGGGILEATTGNDSNLLIVFYVQIMPDDFVMQLHRF
ncbi:hypothetical protein J4W69_24920 [Escherichia coli]|nr:hypothetical protein CWI33_02380 [Escherichia coli]OJO49704.1 hypothetical protein BK321_15800 [Escherichia coli]PBR39130.1 hypothetical protein COD53_24605 [Escherichia coli]